MTLERVDRLRLTGPHGGSAARVRIQALLPIAFKLDKAGLWSLETRGEATSDACIPLLV